VKMSIFVFMIYFMFAVFIVVFRHLLPLRQH